MTSYVILIIFLGIITSYEDIQYSKVRNKLLLLFCFLNTVLLIVDFVNTGPAVFHFSIWQIILNAVCAFLAGYILWKINIWPPGDAKLFAVFSFILPLTYYSESPLPVFPSFSLLINVFAVALVFVVVHIIAMLVSTTTVTKPDLKSKVSERIDKLKTNWLEYLNYTLGMVSLFLFINLISRPLQQALHRYIPGFTLIFFILVFLFFHRLMKFIKGRNFIVIFLVITTLFLAYLILWDKQSTMQSLITLKDIIENALVMFFAMAGINAIFIMYLKISEEQRVAVRELSAKSVLTQDSMKKVQEKIDDIGPIYPEGLSQEQLEKIKSKFRAEEEFSLYRTMAFAPTMFIGVIVTMFFRQSVVHLFLTYVFRR
ncbi:prepilin peptidase [bacterium]